MADLKAKEKALKETYKLKLNQHTGDSIDQKINKKLRALKIRQEQRMTDLQRMKDANIACMYERRNLLRE